MSEIRKNDEFEIEITDMSNDGEGIGHANGMAFFVKGAVVGDIILAGATKLKKNYGYARIVKIIKPSSARVQPKCPIASRCGGCSLQHMDYKAQLEYKQKKVLDALVRIGGLERERFVFDGTDEAWRFDDEDHDNTAGMNDKIRFYDILGMDDPYYYRNKGQFPVGTDRNGKTVCGFYTVHSHDIIDTDSCLLQHGITDRLMEAVRKYMSECGVGAYCENPDDTPKQKSRKGNNDHAGSNGIIRHVLTRVGFMTHEVMVCIVIAADDLPYKDRLVRLLNAAVELYNSENNADYSLNSVSFNVNKENTNVIMGDKVVTIAGFPFITDYIGDLQYRISPLSFYQVNPVQTEKLYSAALEFAAPKTGDTVWDLYCGIGTISLFMAKYAGKVIGIEIVPQAIEDARENAKMNGITNAEFICGAAEEVMPELLAQNSDTSGDIVVVDPPRKGCDEKLLASIAQIAPGRIVYVSCDPATLARDIRILRDYGYEPRKVQPTEMFPQTNHVETVALLQHKEHDDEKR